MESVTFSEQEYRKELDKLLTWIEENENRLRINAAPYEVGRQLLTKMLPLVRAGVLPPQAVAQFEQIVNAAAPPRSSPELVTKAINRQLTAGTLSLVQARRLRILAGNLPSSFSDPDRWFPPAA